MFDEKNAHIYEIKKNPFYFKTTWAQHKTYALNYMYIVTFKKTLSMSLPLKEMTTTRLQMESL